MLRFTEGLNKTNFSKVGEKLVLAVIFIKRLTSRFELRLQQTYVLIIDAICVVCLQKSISIISNESQNRVLAVSFYARFTLPELGAVERSAVISYFSMGIHYEMKQIEQI